MRLLTLNLQQSNKFIPKMSFTPAFKYINAQDLAEIVKKNDPKEVQVIDVRDDDFVGESSYLCGSIVMLTIQWTGGNIKGAVNSPSESFTQNVTELVKQYDEGKSVVTIEDKQLTSLRGSPQSRVPCVISPSP